MTRIAKLSCLAVLVGAVLAQAQRPVQPKTNPVLDYLASPPPRVEIHAVVTPEGEVDDVLNSKFEVKFLRQGKNYRGERSDVGGRWSFSGGAVDGVRYRASGAQGLIVREDHRTKSPPAGQEPLISEWYSVQAADCVPMLGLYGLLPGKAEINGNKIRWLMASHSKPDSVVMWGDVRLDNSGRLESIIQRETMVIPDDHARMHGTNHFKLFRYFYDGAGVVPKGFPTGWDMTYYFDGVPSLTKRVDILSWQNLPASHSKSFDPAENRSEVLRTRQTDTGEQRRDKDGNWVTMDFSRPKD